MGVRRPARGTPGSPGPADPPRCGPARPLLRGGVGARSQAALPGFRPPLRRRRPHRRPGRSFRGWLRGALRGGLAGPAGVRARPRDARAERDPAFPQTGAEKAAASGGRAASEPTRWNPDTLPQGAPPRSAQHPGSPAQYLFLKPKRPPCSPGTGLLRPACSPPGPGVSGTGNVDVVTGPPLKWPSPRSVCGHQTSRHRAGVPDLAPLVLTQVLVRRLDDGTELRGRIVETEAYLGPEDEAARSRGGRQTPRNRGMFMKPGTLYVYFIYGMYFCMNVSSQGDGACVLLRALEPLGGLETMRQLRSTSRKGSTGRTLKDRELCSGPSKLCQALAIDKSFDQRDLTTDKAVWLEHSPPGPREPAVVAAARVGIGNAGEWAQKPLRFYIQGSPWVSVVDRGAEQDTQV